MIDQMSTRNTTQNSTKNEKPYVIVDFLDLDTSKFSFQAPKKNSHGGTFIPVRYDGKILYVSYEARTCPFGISTNTENKNEYKGKYPDAKKITGFSTSISCLKEYETDPYYQKAEELDQFFIDACTENCLQWNLGPLERKEASGKDERGWMGKWKRFLKWSYKKNEKTGGRDYLDYAPRLEFGIPVNGNITEHQGSDGLLVQEATLSPVFFDQSAQKLEPVNSTEADQVVPKWSRVSVLAHWSTITQGTYGATLKPKAKQFRVYPNEQLATDECLLDDDEEDYDIGDQLGGDFGGGATVTKLNNNPAPLDTEEEADDAVEIVDGHEQEEEVEAEPEPEPEPVAVKPVRSVTRPTRRVVTAKKA